MSNVINDLQKKIKNWNLFEKRDWPHRGKKVTDVPCFELLHYPLNEFVSPGGKNHNCDNCNQGCQCIHDNVLCWKCKGAFCLWCTAPQRNPNLLTNLPVETIVEKGFGTCPTCQEPLRAIAMPIIFRQMKEMSAFGPDGNQDGGFKILQSEAEMALKQANHFRKKIKADADDEDEKNNNKNSDEDEKNRKKAISEYTHAINCINTIASTTRGNRFALRAKDIYLISHIHRAKLEGNKKLAKKIKKIQPEASIRPQAATLRRGTKYGSTNNDRKKNYIAWNRFDNAFYNLFFTPPVMWVNHLLHVDTRNAQSRQAALDSDYTIFQLENKFNGVLNIRNGVSNCPEVQSCGKPALNTINNTYSSLSGIRRGANHFQPLVHPNALCHQEKMSSLIQFCWAFPTFLDASEYMRIKIENKEMTEENTKGFDYLKCKFNKKLSHKLTKKFNKLNSGGEKLQTARIYVTSTSTTTASFAIAALNIMAVISNVACKVYVCYIDMTSSRQNSDPGTLAGRPKNLEDFLFKKASTAMVHMYRRIKYFKTISTSELLLFPENCHDGLVCSFCGITTGHNEPLLRCSRCRGVNYCSKACQQKHWDFPANPHKKVCKKVKSATSNHEKETDQYDKLTIGTRVRIFDLKSEAGKKLNGKIGYVGLQKKKDDNNSRVGIVLEDNLSIDGVLKCIKGTITWDELSNKPMKSLKQSNLMIMESDGHGVMMMPMISS